MDEMKKRRFQILEGNDGEISEEQDRKRKNIRRLIFIFAVIMVVAAIAVYIFLKYKTYDSYQVLEERKMETITESEFYDFKDNLLKVSKNGAIYTTVEGKLIWNQSYEMNAPIVDVCQNYAVVGSKKGSEVYIFSTKGTEGKIATSGKLRAVEVADQGTIAVMTENNDSYYVNMYDTKGEKLVQGEMHIENSGYPLAMSLSADALKLAISLVDIKDGQADTTLNFYNFGTVGQNEIDNLVNSYTYKNEIIPKIHYLDENKAVAFSTDKIRFYKGSQKPEEIRAVDEPGEVRSIFFSDKYVGCSYNVIIKDEETKKTKKVHELCLYDDKGKVIMEEQYGKDYEKIEILDNEEIVMSMGDRLCIYQLNGTMKYRGKMKEDFLKIERTGKGNEYYILYKDKLQKIRLK